MKCWRVKACSNYELRSTLLNTAIVKVCSIERRATSILIESDLSRFDSRNNTLVVRWYPYFHELQKKAMATLKLGRFQGLLIDSTITTLDDRHFSRSLD
jgi:hypothetical protein